MPTVSMMSETALPLNLVHNSGMESSSWHTMKPFNPFTETRIWGGQVTEIRKVDGKVGHYAIGMDPTKIGFS
jgi:hypothetical protein